MRETIISAISAAVFCLLAFGYFPPFNGHLFSPRPSWADEAWKNEFQDVCSRTQDAAGFSADELKSLIARCDALKPRVEKLLEPERKIYLRRLQMCRDLYAFVLEARESR